MLRFKVRCTSPSNYHGKKVWWFVLTGGPCSGKTTALARLKKDLTNKGYKVFMIDEAATRIINSGISYKELGNYEFQSYIATTQLVNEALIEDAIQKYIALPNSKDDIVIICDRGIMDGKAYMDSEEDFKNLMESFGTSVNKARSSYDVVVHLVTAANGAEEYYTLENNEARSESPEEARAIDRKTFAAWSGHKHIAIIDNSTDFDKKIDRALENFYRMLGVPIPIDSFKKYLISMPNLLKLEKDFYCNFSKVEITRTYLINKNNASIERSVIKTGADGDNAYYYNEKRHFEGYDKIDVERHISKKEYISLLSGNNVRIKEIKKTRYGFVWNNKYYELDVFDFWKDKAILKVQLTDRSDEVEVPSVLNVLMDITNDMSYTNFSLAQNIFD